MKKQIPNLITLCNLLCGTMAAYAAAIGHLDTAAMLIMAGIVFDFFDGMVARMLQVSSPIGRELDSLADVVTSGVAPAVIVYQLFSTEHAILGVMALLIPAFSAYRLATFNLDTTQSTSFRGLPTPANALVWAALGLLYSQSEVAKFTLIPTETLNNWIFSTPGVIVLALLSFVLDLLMVSNVRMLSLKFHDLRWRNNSSRYLLLLTSITVILLMGVLGIAVAILLYVLLSLLTKQTQPAPSETSR